MHAERLEQLAAFLDNLDPKQFDYSTFGYKAKCGTVACALGWCHKAFKECISEVSDVPRFTVGDFTMSYSAFFGIHDAERKFLFFPYNTDTDSTDIQVHAQLEGFKRMNPSSTAKEVAAHIRKFIANGGIYDH